MYYPLEINFSPNEVLVYLRKSRADDPLLTVEEVLSKHETILDEWAERNLGAVVPEENKYREVVSGETIEARPEIQKILRYIESPKVKAILTVEIQRLSRGDLEDAGRLIKLLRYTNTLVITPQKTYDLKDEYDRDIFERELKRGNEFLEYQKKIMGRGRLLSVSQGNFIGSVPPYGYDKAWIIEGKRKCPTLSINEEQANAVRMAFELYVNQDMGINNICSRFDSLGINPPKGENWSPAALKDMLSNVHYIGKVKWNWRKTVTVVEDSEIIKTRPKAENYLIYDGKHPAIVSEELFYNAQAKRGRNRRARPKTKVRNPLAGIVYCQCGRAMSLRTYMKDGKQRAPARLICDNQTHCKTSSCLYDEMVEQVCKILQRSIADFEVLLKNDNNEARILQEKHIQTLKNKIEELNKKEINQWEKYSEEGMPKEIFDRLNAKVLQEKEELQQALKTARESIPAYVDYENALFRFRDALAALTSTTVSAEQKNRLLKSCIERITYNRGQSVRLTKKTAGTEVKLHTGGNWTAEAIELDVKLRMDLTHFQK